MNLNRRGFIGGLLASVAMPTLDIKPAIFMHSLTEYVPTISGGFDILYGYKYIKPEWIELNNKIPWIENVTHG